MSSLGYKAVFSSLRHPLVPVCFVVVVSRRFVLVKLLNIVDLVLLLIHKAATLWHRVRKQPVRLVDAELFFVRIIFYWSPMQKFYSPVAVAEWLARLTAMWEVSRLNPASCFC